MRRLVLAGLLLAFSLSCLPASWSQDSPTGAPSSANWQNLAAIQTRLSTLQATHGLTLNAALVLLLRQREELEKLVLEHGELRKLYEASLEEISKAKSSIDSLLTRITELEERLTSSKSSLEKASTIALGLEIEREILWAASGIIGLGLIAYGIWRGDPIPAIAGGAMAAGSALHFVLELRPP